MLNGFFLAHLLNFVEQIFCDLRLWYNLDNKFVWSHLYAFFNSFGVLSKVYLSWIFKVLCMLICNLFIFVACLPSLIHYIGYTPLNPKWLRCAWNSNFTYKYAHIYMECVLYVVVSLTMLNPISLGTKMYLNIVLGTLEMQWRLVSSIRKVLSPYEN